MGLPDRLIIRSVPGTALKSSNPNVRLLRRSRWALSVRHPGDRPESPPRDPQPLSDGVSPKVEASALLRDACVTDEV